MTERAPSIVAVGACHLDRKARAEVRYAPGASNPVTLSAWPGGVARNVAENLVRLGAGVALVSRLGRDDDGLSLLAGLGDLAIDTSGVALAESAPTAFHLIALQPDGEMLVAVADMRIYDEITPALLKSLPAALWQADAIFADCNLPGETLAFLAGRCDGARRFAVNAVSPAKALRLRPLLSAGDFLFVNRGEAAALLDCAAEGLDPAAAAAKLRAGGAGEVILTLGGAGLCIAAEGEPMMLKSLEAKVVDITGAGDALAAAYLDARLRGLDPAASGRRALAAAALTVTCEESVCPGLTPEMLDARETA